MPSSAKTECLRLNHWRGADKPKRDDFNHDNLLIDKGVSNLKSDLKAANTAHDTLKNTVNTALDAMGQRCSGVSSDISAHKADGGVHISPGERAAWNQALEGAGGAGDPVVGTYAGTGTPTIKIKLGFRPRFGFLFAVGSSLAECSFMGQQINLYSACFSSSGCSRNLALEADGVLVTHNTAVPVNGNACFYNTQGKTYVYAAWR